MIPNTLWWNSEKKGMGLEFGLWQRQGVGLLSDPCWWRSTERRSNSECDKEIYKENQMMYLAGEG